MLFYSSLYSNGSVEAAAQAVELAQPRLLVSASRLDSVDLIGSAKRVDLEEQVRSDS